MSALDPELSLIAAAWPKLSPIIRRCLVEGVLAEIKQQEIGDKSQPPAHLQGDDSAHAAGV